MVTERWCCDQSSFTAARRFTNDGLWSGANLQWRCKFALRSRGSDDGMLLSVLDAGVSD